MRHLESRPLESTLDIKSLVRLRAIQDGLHTTLALFFTSMLPPCATTSPILFPARFNTNRNYKTYLIAPNLLRHKIQCLNNPEPQLLSLLILRDGNILNVPDEAELVDEFTLDDEGACADDFAGAVGDAEEEVLVVARGHPCVAVVPLLSTRQYLCSVERGFVSGRKGCKLGKGG